MHPSLEACKITRDFGSSRKSYYQLLIDGDDDSQKPHIISHFFLPISLLTSLLDAVIPMNHHLVSIQHPVRVHILASSASVISLIG
jgi:hypothetical protein